MDYKAKQGDIVWITLDPQSGHEQKGRRPAIVISNNTFNGFMKTAAMLCPITNTDRKWPVHVKLDERTKTCGVILCDQTKILDIQVRNAQFIEKAPEDIVFEAVDIVMGFVETENQKSIVTRLEEAKAKAATKNTNIPAKKNDVER